MIFAIKNNQKELSNILNVSREENRTFLARLKSALEKKFKSPKTFS